MRLTTLACISIHSSHHSKSNSLSYGTEARSLAKRRSTETKKTIARRLTGTLSKASSGRSRTVENSPPLLALTPSPHQHLLKSLPGPPCCALRHRSPPTSPKAATASHASGFKEEGLGQFIEIKTRSGRLAAEVCHLHTHDSELGHMESYEHGDLPAGNNG